MRQLYIVLACMAILFSACRADFSPNAEWKEIPSVYCLLDQDDSVTYVRVQKCYLGDENLKQYATIADSSNYGPDELLVRIFVWASEDAMSQADAAPLKTLDFAYQLRTDKPAGTFYAPDQPVYCHVNKPGDLNPDYTYQLVVSKAATGQVISRATTHLIGDCAKTVWLESPHPSILGRSFNFRKNRGCIISWYPFPRGRRYQITLGFRYRCQYVQPEILRGISMTCPDVVSDFSESELYSTMSQDTYFTNIANALASDTTTKVYVDTLSITLFVCNEPLNAYLNSIDMMNGSLEQNQQVYTNIEGGVGVFGARRTHLSLLVPTDNSDVGPTGMHFLLEKLHVGFGK
ncbi:MAG: DUF4249 family protein [Bacteroidales bacterium]|nr:DUF4249 family protein [Bacteroidales bacterium]